MTSPRLASFSPRREPRSIPPRWKSARGLVTLCQQITRSVLGIDQVAVIWDDTSQIGSAGSTSASRQTQMTGGAVHAAALGLRDKILSSHDGDGLRGDGVYRGNDLIATIEEVCAAGSVDHWVRFRHPPTESPDENGQGDVHAGFAVALLIVRLSTLIPSSGLSELSVSTPRPGCRKGPESAGPDRPARGWDHAGGRTRCHGGAGHR